VVPVNPGVVSVILGVVPVHPGVESVSPGVEPVGRARRIVKGATPEPGEVSSGLVRIAAGGGCRGVERRQISRRTVQGYLDLVTDRELDVPLFIRCR